MEKEPLKSVQVSTGTRVYYFDVHKDRRGDEYISVSEIPTDSSPGNKKRNHIFIHAQNADRIMSALNEVVDYIKREKK